MSDVQDLSIGAILLNGNEIGENILDAFTVLKHEDIRIVELPELVCSTYPMYNSSVLEAQRIFNSDNFELDYFTI